MAKTEEHFVRSRGLFFPFMLPVSLHVPTDRRNSIKVADIQPTDSRIGSRSDRFAAKKGVFNIQNELSGDRKPILTNRHHTETAFLPSKYASVCRKRRLQRHAKTQKTGIFHTLRTAFWREKQPQLPELLEGDRILNGTYPLEFQPLRGSWSRRNLPIPNLPIRFQHYPHPSFLYYIYLYIK